MKWLIWSHEHNMWWNPFRCGYTANINEAGRYEFEEAMTIIREANFIPAHRPKESMVPDQFTEESNIIALDPDRN